MDFEWECGMLCNTYVSLESSLSNLPENRNKSLTCVIALF